MSRTPSVGIYPPCHWTNMATVVHGWLEKVLQKGEIIVGFLPINIYTEAKEFLFVAARRATGDHMLDCEETHADRFALSRKLLQEAEIPCPNGTLPILHMFCSFFETLNTPRMFWGEERAMCSNMAKFFLALKQEGETRPYETPQEYHERMLQEGNTRLEASMFMRGMMPRG